jgi:uncharacterized protein YqhQ
MSNKTSNEKFKSKIGGQALIEGIMMRGIDKSAMACRLPSGEIDVEEWAINNGKNRPWYKKTPFIRGVFNFVETLVEGYKCLSKSADKQMSADDEKPSKFEAWLERKLGDKLMPVITTFATILGVLLAVALFVFLPTFIVKFFDNFIDSNFLLTLIEGVIKIVIFIVYLALTLLMKDIQTTYEYHGAEHKTIACYEAGEELTVENIKKYSRFHPRCGTSFILFVLIISILVFSVVTWSSRLKRTLLKLLLLPVVMGIAYELIKIAGKYTNPITKIISAPGIALQRLTTREPNDKQIEVAIAAMERVIPEDKEEDKW